MANGNGSSKYTKWIWMIYNDRPAYNVFRHLVKEIVKEVLAEFGFLEKKQNEDVKNVETETKTSDITG